MAQNNECVRIAEQSRRAEAAARHAHDVQEDKIKILSDQVNILSASEGEGAPRLFVQRTDRCNYRSVCT